MLSLLSLGPFFNLFWSRIFSQKTQGTIFRVKAVTIVYVSLTYVLFYIKHTLSLDMFFDKHAPCADLESFVRAINLDSFVTDINGQSSARQRNAIEMEWRFAGGPMILGIQTSIVKPYMWLNLKHPPYIMYDHLLSIVDKTCYENLSSMRHV